jgi:OmpA-OmpF porin, OOP family
MKNFVLFSSVVLMFLITRGLMAQTEDSAGCKDHPMFTRIPDYLIIECSVKEADTFSFPIESRIADDAKREALAGKNFSYSYIVKEGARGISSILIFRDMEDKLMQSGGRVVARVIEPGNSLSFITGKINQENLDTWILVQATGYEYRLKIVEIQRKVKVIPADEMWNTMVKKDSVTLDIFFDDDTTTIFPASLPVIDQVYKMMISHPSLKLDIQCHTDNKIIRRDRKILSADRAKEVLDVLTAKGVEKSRLTSHGYGYDKPVANNKTDEGRAMNRRIVLVMKKGG